jgi:arylsulfatase A-like enzyme
MYEGGVRVPGIIEWPAVVQKPTATSVVAATTDLLPTLAEITNQPLPERPLDGVSLLPWFTEPERQREKPLFFWQIRPNQMFGKDAEPYIDPVLQEGTTPLAKMMAGKYTRDFTNYKYTHIEEGHYAGERSMMLGDYKLVLEARSPNKEGFELYNITADPAETTNLADDQPERVKTMSTALRQWQESVLNSLTGADYQP